jgi:phospholipid/cholesterol/gamma-HCH transport system ATP-binding protein
MRKRVSVARALVGNPKIVLFDEPTVALDSPTSGTICDLIIELRDLENVASIVVTHEMDVVKYLTSEYATIRERGKIEFKDEGQQLCLTNTNILMLRNGREIFSGTSKELIESDDPYIQNFIRGTELLPERAESRE